MLCLMQFVNILNPIIFFIRDIFKKIRFVFDVFLMIFFHKYCLQYVEFSLIHHVNQSTISCEIFFCRKNNFFSRLFRLFFFILSFFIFKSFNEVFIEIILSLWICFFANVSFRYLINFSRINLIFSFLNFLNFFCKFNSYQSSSILITTIMNFLKFQYVIFFNEFFFNVYFKSSSKHIHFKIIISICFI